MFRKFIQGLIFGAGFSISLAIVYTLWITWALPRYLNEIANEQHANIPHPATPSTSKEEVSIPPTLTDTKRFLGSPAIYSGDFMDNLKGNLSSGDGKIIGAIRSNNQPIKGVRIRLALNGSVLSQWSVSTEDGRYTIAVPYGEYRIDGYEIETQSANEYLAGKIDHPRNGLFGESRFVVGPTRNGEGLNLDFVDPVVKTGPSGEVSLSKDIVATWQAYPGAEHYVIQIYENENIHDYIGQKRLFKWSERPVVNEPMINLTAYKVPLKIGFYYTLEVQAKNKTGTAISETARKYSEKDFKVVN